MMAGRRFIFNKDSLKVDVHRISPGRAVWLVVKYLSITFAVAVLYYLLISLLFDTDEDRRLKDENALLSSELERIGTRMDILENVTEGLGQRDAGLYRSIFSSLPPEYILDSGDTARADISELHGMNDDDIVWNAYVTVAKMDGIAGRVSSQIEDIQSKLQSDASSLSGIPSIIPLRNFSPGCTGASVGNKFNPFFKTIRRHEGIDLMAPEGAEVLAAADGTVVTVERQERGFGNRVVIDHPSGLKTVYAHLADISVREGQRVSRGNVIGHAGTSGRAFAPHLHYEVISGERHLEPVHYFFSELNENTYREMLIMALTAGQSMD